MVLTPCMELAKQDDDSNLILGEFAAGKRCSYRYLWLLWKQHKRFPTSDQQTSGTMADDKSKGKVIEVGLPSNPRTPPHADDLGHDVDRGGAAQGRGTVALLGSRDGSGVRDDELLLTSISVLVPSIPDIETGLRLALTGEIKYSVIGEERIAQYLLAVFNSRRTPLYWDHLANERIRSAPELDKTHADVFPDSTARKRRQLDTSDVLYIKQTSGTRADDKSKGKVIEVGLPSNPRTPPHADNLGHDVDRRGAAQDRGTVALLWSRDGSGVRDDELLLTSISDPKRGRGTQAGGGGEKLRRQVG
ncbi:hypothetical protein ZIOFF_051301 [Zingiber officinale]|uniref:Uncharacterized protein n=1 Tax=Zingiber officinale TaxID=94328 RepID=A0A8J5FLT7_ZINOF|nr:hypothetical protein ZIOFF_051301 [Zingiber officinale]